MASGAACSCPTAHRFAVVPRAGYVNHFGHGWISSRAQQPMRHSPVADADKPMDADSPKMFLTAAEVGAILHLKKSRVYQLAAAGILPSIRLGERKILFSRRGLEALDQEAIDRAWALRGI
jgi:excisionase family DNA binding protein